VIGGVFYTALHGQSGASVYAHAFATGLACNVATLVVLVLLSLALGSAKRSSAQTVIVSID
jgi:Flp pilus assembly CpaE family ATPase